MEIIKAYKNFYKSLNDYFEKESDYTTIEFLLVCLISLAVFIGTSLLFMLISILVSKFFLIYIFLSILILLLLTGEFIKSLKIIEIIIVFELPLILTYMLTNSIYYKFRRYKGNDPMILRTYKLKSLKRKIFINKLKFWNI